MVRFLTTWGLPITIFLALSVVAFPTTFRYHYAAIQTYDIFNGLLPWFECLYVLAVGFGILSGSVHAYGNRTKPALLSVTMALMNSEFWNIRSNLPIPISDGQANHAYVAALVVNGHLLGFATQDLSFFSAWPNTQLIGAILQQMLLLNTSVAMVLESTIVIALVAVASYLFFFTLTSSPFRSLVGVILLTFFSARFQIYFYTPNNLAFAIAILGLWLVARGVFSGTMKRSSSLAILILMLGIGFTNFIISAFLASTFVVLWTLSPSRKTLAPFVPIVAAASLLPPLYNGGLGIITGSAREFLSGNLISQLLSFYGSQAGGLIPVWASYVTFFWQVVMVAPAVFALGLLLWKRSELPPRRLHLCLLIVGLIPFGLGLASGGGYYAAVLLGVIPLFTIPFILQTSGKLGRTFVVLVVVLIVGLSLPTFLAYNRNQEIWELYPTDTTSYSFISHRSSVISGYTLYMTGVDTLPLYINNVDVVYPMAKFLSLQQLWSIWDTTLAVFHSSSAGSSVLVFSSRSVVPWASQLGIPPGDAHWTEIRSSISTLVVIYSNGGTLLAR
jgi:hypothetical protein